MKTQKNAVVSTILSVLSSAGIDYELGGEVIVKDVLTDTMKKEVRSIIKQGFLEGDIQMSDDAKTKYIGPGLDAELNKYVSGLVNNWIKKYKEFNNGEAYVPKNKGSRTGQGDEQVRELRKLLKQVRGTEHEAKVQAALDERLAEIKPKAAPINASVLPAHLKDLVQG